ncbi:MAG TPA: DUF1707 domain-containing protein [Gaiellaceae bacterium]|nr:DUF1707 domain-containing protein [Gaiellaceae bacterium]
MAVLVGDSERDGAANELRRHYREGRLTVDELALRLEAALRARTRPQLRSVLNDLPALRRWTDAEGLRAPVRTVRNAAILLGTAVIWFFWSAGLFVAFVAWLAANGASLGALLVFPLLWFAVSWLLWSGSRRRRARR